MKTALIPFLLLTFYSVSQKLNDGRWSFANEEIKMDLLVKNNGESLVASITYLSSENIFDGTGEYYNNASGDTELGYYEVKTSRCSYTFTIPSDPTVEMELSEWGCTNEEEKWRNYLVWLDMENVDLDGYDESDQYVEVEEYFTAFLNKSGNELADVFLQHQPTLNDCKLIFSNDYYREAYKNFNQSFASIGDQIENQTKRFSGKNACRATEFNTNEMINGTCDICPGAYKYISDKVKPNIICYKIEFLETEDSELGVSASFFVFLNNRWVYFPLN